MEQRSRKIFYLTKKNHPSFNEEISNEIYSWISLWMDELQDKLEEPIEQVLGSDWEDLILEGGISHVDETLGEFLSSVDLSKKDKYQDLIAVMGETNVRISETKNVQVPFVTDFKPATKDAETAHLCFEYNIYASLYYYFVAH